MTHASHSGMVGLQKGSVKLRERAVSDDPVPKSEEWLRLAAQVAQMGLWYWNEVTSELFWDTKTREIFGSNLVGEVTLETFYNALHPEDLAHVKEIWRYELERGLPYDLGFRALTPDGSIRWIQARGSGYYDKDRKPLCMVGVVFDVTERKLADQERIELSGRLINAQERERTRLARELHDDFSQRLALLTLELENVAEMIEVSPKAANARVAELRNAVTSIEEDIRSLSHRLHSSTLESLGLVVSVRSFCADVAKQHGIQIDFVEKDIPKSMPPDIALCLFRIVQEGLRNVSKHSRASRAEVRLEADSKAISLGLSDNGVGFEFSQSLASIGIGIRSMKERTWMLGGRFEVVSQPTQGTQITVFIPLNSARNAT
jgi:PAS domain S-box-containing protein